MSQEEYHNKIGNEFKSLIYSCLPSEWIAGHGSNGLVFNVTLRQNNDAYRKSQYYFEHDKKFVHWTSVQNLMSIINNREVRLYNLQNSTDVEEFKFAASQLTIPDSHINHSKRYLYTFSFCKSEEISNSDLWNEHGRNYQGIAFEFEITNSPEKWENFMLAPVYYELPKHLIELMEKLERFKLKYSGVETEIDLGRLIAFHKSPMKSKEKEVRLSVYFPFKNLEEYWKNCNTEFRLDNKRPRITDYFGLKLWVDNESPWVKSKNPKFDRRIVFEEGYFIEKPQIKITKIHFGKNCGFDNRNFSSFRTKLEEVIDIKLGYKVDLPINLFG